MFDETDCHVNIKYISVAHYVTTGLFRKLKCIVIKVWWIFTERMYRLHYHSHKHVDITALYTTKRQYLYKYGSSLVSSYNRIGVFLTMILKITPEISKGTNKCALDVGSNVLLASAGPNRG
jgi:hypothetical protein